MKNIMLIILLFTLLNKPISLKSQCIEQDSLALVDLYNCLGGPSWITSTNWLTGSVHSWFGIKMNTDSTRVQKVLLGGNNLEGILPNSITNLTACSELEFGADLISGTIPDSIGKLSQLKILTLANNKLNGEIPFSIGQLNNLEQLHLGGNNLCGSLPITILNLLQSPPLLNLIFNKLTSVPIFPQSWFTPGVSMDLRWNKLSFENFEYNPPTGQMSYTPQDSMYDPVDTTVLAGSDLWIHSKVGGSANQYFWVKNQVGIPGETDTSLLLENITFADSGYYSCVINNPLVPLLTLWRHSVHVRVVDTVSGIHSSGLASRTSVRFNPQDQALSISVNTDKPYQLAVSLLDISGREACRLFQGITATTRHTFSLPSLPPGMYLVKIMLDKEQITRKIILTE